MGVVDYRYVLYEYARPWLLHTLRHVTSASQREEEQEQVRINSTFRILAIDRSQQIHTSRSIKI